MSYTIMYGRQFIKTTRGIIPLALYGSNNVYEFINGREVRERNWGIYGQKPEYTTEEYLALTESYCGLGCNEHFMRAGKWVNDKGWMNWVRNGIRKALTIEEIKKEIPSQCLYCFINDGDKIERKNEQFIHATPDLENWLDKAYARLKSLKGAPYDSFVSISLMGREPLKITAHKEPVGEVLIAIGRGKYITTLERRAYSYSPDITKALVFNSSDEAREMLADYDISFRKEMRFIKAENKTVTKDYMILAKTDSYPAGVYIERLTGRSLRLTSHPSYALRFTESSAKKYVGKLGNRFRGVREYSIVNLTEGDEK